MRGFFGRDRSGKSRNLAFSRVFGSIVADSSEQNRSHSNDPMSGGLKLLKIGAQIQVTVRKVWVRLSQSYPYQALFRAIHENLSRSPRYQPLRC